MKRGNDSEGKKQNAEESYLFCQARRNANL